MNPRILVITVVLILLATATMWIQNDSKKQINGDQQGKKSQHIADYFMEDFEITTMNAKGQPSSLLVSEKMLHYPDDDSTELSKPLMTMYRDNGMPWKISADRGWVSANNELILLSGNVLIKRTSGPGNRPVELFTDRLRIHPKTDFAETDQPITMLSNKRRTTAIGMRAYIRLGQLQLLNDVRVTYDK